MSNTGEYIEIYGARIKLPPVPDEKDILFHDKPVREQKWVRPDITAEIGKAKAVSVGKKEEDVAYMYTDTQQTIIERELKRFKNGVWFMNNGTPTYITGRHYFFLSIWILEDDSRPEYRDTSRKYFLYHDYYFKREWCQGIQRAKKRREGATSEATSNLVYAALFSEGIVNCGTVSKTEEDVKKNFEDMIRKGFNELPFWLKPSTLTAPHIRSEIITGKRDGRGKPIIKAKINYRSLSENAYDSGRITYLLVDESGKFGKDVDASKMLRIISQTLVKGTERVGFSEWPSTVNEMEKKGGKGFFKNWRDADNTMNPTLPTKNNYVRYFSPAYEGLVGFIDEYGNSVVDAPSEEQFEYLSKKYIKYDEDGNILSTLTPDLIKKGAKRYLEEHYFAGLEGEALYEMKRMYPCSEEDIFAGEAMDSIYNIQKINNRLKSLEENPLVYRNILYYRDSQDGKVKWRDAEAGEKFAWKTVMTDYGDHSDAVSYEGGKYYVNREDVGCISVDGYSNTQGGEKYGSKACAMIGLKLNPLDPDNTLRAIALLHGRPKVKETLHEQVMLACEYWGFMAYYEHNADDYYTFFYKRQRVEFLAKYPESTIDPVKRGSSARYRGISTTPFSIVKQNDTSADYVEFHCDNIMFEEILKDHKDYDQDHRTKFDITVSHQILTVAFNDRQKRKRVTLGKDHINPNFLKN